MELEREHKKFSPSKSEQFFLCPGSVNLLARVPARPTSSHAIEGTRAHTVLEAGLTNGCRNATDAIAHSIHCVEDFPPDFYGSVNDALDYIWALVDELKRDHGSYEMFVEVKVDPPVTSAPGEAAGYCDVAVFSKELRRLWVIDYKHGAGVAKAAIGNSQVKQYAAGFLYQDTNALVDKDLVDTVTLVIIQPRAFHPDGDIREYNTTPLELVDYLIELDGKIEEAMRPDAPLIPGTEQCRFCDARSVCPAVEAKSLSAISTQFRTVRDVTEPGLPPPSTIDLDRLSYIKHVAPLIRSWLDDVDKHLWELMMDGNKVKGLKLVEAQARRKYYGDEKERATKLAALIGCHERDLYRTEFKPLTEVEEMIVDAFKQRVARNRKKQAAEEAKQMFAYYTLKESSGKLSVVTEDDERPEANRALASFGQIANSIPQPTTTE